MLNKLLLVSLLLVSSFSVVAKQQEVPLNLFKWAKAGFGVTFPQTYVIHKRDGVRYGRLGLARIQNTCSHGSNKPLTAL